MLGNPVTTMSSKNVVIYSDGTGQAGGFRFDENRSNIYKMYRATRCGPDTSIDPRDQLTFYDPGLGSQADGGHLAGRFFRWIYNTISQATGFGITANIVDCYAALIRLWNPGDRIFLIGFSRGAYTVRSLAGVIAMCGIPRRMKENLELRLDIDSTRKLAEEAVKHIYQFTSSWQPGKETPRQKFLLETRSRLAATFREEHASGTPQEANAYPYFIGVFDTVAALGSAVKFTFFLVLFLIGALVVSFVLSYLTNFPDAPWFGSVFQWLSTWHVFSFVVALAGCAALMVYIYTHLKFDFHVPGYTKKQGFDTIHFTELWQRFYNTDLDPHVYYAKHAISIDENRKDFKRVEWGRKDEKVSTTDPHGNRWFEQVWFAGNHADVGGSYPENEARLSDIALGWMVASAASVPNGLRYEPSLLQLFPQQEGMQHDEIKAGLGVITKWFHYTWSEEHRRLPRGPGQTLSVAIMHRSVYQRFDMPAVQVYDLVKAYRPETLRLHKHFAPFYEVDARFPADSWGANTEAAAMSATERLLWRLPPVT
jgi:uncharacterized protein (DUF2235 family)